MPWYTSRYFSKYLDSDLCRMWTLVLWDFTCSSRSIDMAAHVCSGNRCMLYQLAQQSTSSQRWLLPTFYLFLWGAILGENMEGQGIPALRFALSISVCKETFAGSDPCWCWMLALWDFTCCSRSVDMAAHDLSGNRCRLYRLAQQYAPCLVTDPSFSRFKTSFASPYVVSHR